MNYIISDRRYRKIAHNTDNHKHQIRHIGSAKKGITLIIDLGNIQLQHFFLYFSNDASDTSNEGLFDGIGNDIKFAMAKASFNFRNSVKEWLSEVLRVLFEAASLCIDTLRTFQLVVLSVLGPLVFWDCRFRWFPTHTYGMAGALHQYLSVASRG